MNATFEEIEKARVVNSQSIETLHDAIEEMWEEIIKLRNYPELDTKGIETLEEMSGWMKKAIDEYQKLVKNARILDPEYNPKPFIGPQRWHDEVKPILKDEPNGVQA